MHKDEKNFKQYCSTFRKGCNLVQQISTYYEYFTGNVVSRDIKTKYYDFKKCINLKDLLNGEYHIVCINDTGLDTAVDAQTQQLKD